MGKQEELKKIVEDVEEDLIGASLRLTRTLNREISEDQRSLVEGIRRRLREIRKDLDKAF